MRDVVLAVCGIGGDAKYIRMLDRSPLAVARLLEPGKRRKK